MGKTKRVRVLPLWLQNAKKEMRGVKTYCLGDAEKKKAAQEVNRSLRDQHRAWKRQQSKDADRPRLRHAAKARAIKRRQAKEEYLYRLRLAGLAPPRREKKKPRRVLVEAPCQTRWPILPPNPGPWLSSLIFRAAPEAST